MEEKSFFKELISEFAVMGIIPLLFVTNLLIFNWKNTVLNSNNYAVFLGVLIFAATAEIIYILTHISGLNTQKIKAFWKKHKIMIIGLVII